MGTLYITEPYCYIHREAERLKIFKQRQLLRDIRVNEYQRVYVHDSSTLTTGAIELLLEKEIDLVYFNGSKYIGRVVGPENKNVTLRIKQVQAHLDEERSFQISRNIVMAKILNTRTVLQRYYRKSKNSEIEQVIASLRNTADKVKDAQNLDEVRGFEGLAARNYFKVFHLLIKNEVDLSFCGRSKRPAKDEVNVLLNYGYAILRAEMSSALAAAGLDPYIGFLHRERYGRESLALDLMEEFRSIFIDTLVLRLVNQPIISKEDFIEEHGSIRLTLIARKKYLQELERRRMSEVTHQLLSKRMSYREVFHKQALLLAKAIKGELDEYYPFLAK